MSKRLNAIQKEIDRLDGEKRGWGRISADNIDVKIGENVYERDIRDSFYSYDKTYKKDVIVNLQELIEHILAYCKLSAKYTDPIPKKLIVEKKKTDAS